MKKYKNVEVESIEKLRELIKVAVCVNEIDDLRWACVKFMYSDPSILKEWQAKYREFKRCSVCGKNI